MAYARLFSLGQGIFPALEMVIANKSLATAGIEVLRWLTFEDHAVVGVTVMTLANVPTLTAEVTAHFSFTVRTLGARHSDDPIAPRARPRIVES
jgi:hypothetical protein